MKYLANPEHQFFNDLAPEAAKEWVSALGPTYYQGHTPVTFAQKPGGVPR